MSSDSMGDISGAHMDRRQTYRIVISKFVKDDWKAAQRLLNIIRADKELDESSVDDLICKIFEGGLQWDPDMFFVRFRDALAHSERRKCFELLRNFADQCPEGSSVPRVLKLCHGLISDLIQGAEFEDASAWSRIALKLASKPSKGILYDHFLDLYLRSLYVSPANSSAIRDLYVQHKKEGHATLHLSYTFLLVALKNQSENDSIQEALSDILQSKLPTSESITKLALYEMLQMTLLPEENEPPNQKLEFAIHLLKEILDMPLTSNFAPQKVYLYQYMTQLMVVSIETSSANEDKEQKALRLLSFLKNKAPTNMRDVSKDVQVWFEQVLFNLGLTLTSSSSPPLKKAAFDCLSLCGTTLFKGRPSLTQVLSCLAGTDLGLSLNLMEDTEALINSALIIAESLDEDVLKGIPHLFSTIYLKRVQVILRSPVDSLKKTMKVIDECLQESRIPGETMEYMAFLFKPRGNPFQRPRIRCLKSALNKPGVNRSDLSQGIHVFIELLKELLSPNYRETLNIPEIKAILNKLIERLQSQKEGSNVHQDVVFQIVGQIWNYSWKLELLDGDSPVVKVLRHMAASLQPFCGVHQNYLLYKMNL